MRDRLSEHQEAEAHLMVIEKLWSRPLLDTQLERLPDVAQGSVLVAESRCGYVPLQWSARLPEHVRIIALDPSRAMLDTARSRMDEASLRRIFLVPQALPSLSYADGVFNAAVCINGLLTRQQLRDGLSELARVIESGGKLHLVVPTRECFSEIYDLLDEAFKSLRLGDTAERLKALRTTLISSYDLYTTAREHGLHELDITEHRWSVAFDSGREALLSPLLRHTFFDMWMSVIRSSEREPILRYLADAIDTYYHERVFTCSMAAIALTASR